jgi:hypothetical protein
MTIALAIESAIKHLPIILFVLALAIALLRGGGAARYLEWLLLLSVGFESLWGGLFHVFSPARAAAFIGWQVSPFQFEIGIADIAFGVVGVASFWRSIDFKAAVVWFAVIFLGGLAIGHVRQILEVGNFTAGNAGSLLAITIVKPLLLLILLLGARRSGATRQA